MYEELAILTYAIVVFTLVGVIAYGLAAIAEAAKAVAKTAESVRSFAPEVAEPEERTIEVPSIAGRVCASGCVVEAPKAGDVCTGMKRLPGYSYCGIDSLAARFREWMDRGGDDGFDPDGSGYQKQGLKVVAVFEDSHLDDFLAVGEDFEGVDAHLLQLKEKYGHRRHAHDGRRSNGWKEHRAFQYR